MQKARQAAVSARSRYDLSDMDGACNRAYYAMFDAARAALLQSDAPVQPEIARTHGGLITAFSVHLVKTGRLPMELGRAINKAEELRLVADYTSDAMDADLHRRQHLRPEGRESRMSSPSWYERHIFPRAMDMACGLPMVGRQRQFVVTLAQGRVPDAAVRRWQDRLQPLWGPLAPISHRLDRMENRRRPDT